MSRTKFKFIFAGIFIIVSVYGASVNAGIRIAILDFELNDFTSLPNTEAEITRTASIQPLLEQALRQEGNYEIVHISREEQKSANAGFGYLFRFIDETAELGKKYAADWIIVGQHSKPSFLESSLIADLIDVTGSNKEAELIVDLKGNHAKVTERAVKELARQVKKVIAEKKK